MNNHNNCIIFIVHRASACLVVLQALLIVCLCSIEGAHGANVTCELRENENFQIEIDACYVIELITLERGERLSFTVKSNTVSNITAVLFVPPGQIQLNITFVPSELFVIFPQLKKLELRAKIDTLDANDFVNATHLQHLTLNNQLSVVPTRIFSLARNLTSITLSKNRITHVEDYAFDGLEQLEQLVLAKNQLKSLNRLAFVGLPKLNFLNLRDNDIETIEDGTFALPNLGELTLSKNRLKTLSDHIFDGATLLRNIAIDNNDLEQIGQSLNNLPNATRIVLYQNKIRDIDILALARLPELTTLWLRESGFSFGNRSLEQFESFSSNSTVTYLDISANNLYDKDDFKRLTIFKQLKTLMLDGNKYTELDFGNRTVRQYFPDMETFHMSQNKWNCEWLRPILTQLINDHIRPVSSDCA